MAQLMNSEKAVLISDLKVADQFWSRTKGLLGTKDLSPEQGLWIHRCNSIHTFFMNYSIDCVFVDKNLVIKSLVKDVKPGRMLWPIWGADSVVELKSGQIEKLGFKMGDQLYVGA